MTSGKIKYVQATVLLIFTLLAQSIFPGVRAQQSQNMGASSDNATPLSAQQLDHVRQVNSQAKTKLNLREGPELKTLDGIYIEKIVIGGASTISQNALREVVRDFEGSLINKDDLQAIANLLTKAYLDRGYFLSKAVIQPQDFENAELVVDIKEGYISQVLINSDPSHPYAVYFEKLLTERPATKKNYARAASLLQLAPGIRIDDRKVSSDKKNKNAYVINYAVTEKKLTTRLSVSNKGVREGESWRTLLSTQLNSVIRTGDQFTAGLITKPAAVSELQYFFGGYQFPIGHSGLVSTIDGVYSNTNPESALASRDLDGNMRSLGLGLSYPIVLSNRGQLIASTRLEWLNSEESEDASMLYKDRLRLLRVRGEYRGRIVGNGQARAYAQYSRGFDLFNASNMAGNQTSRSDADAIFSKFEGEASFQKMILDRWSVTTSVKGQYSSSPLLYLEEFSVGGGMYGRGYDYAEILGDVGAAGFVESGFHGKGKGLIDKWELYSFADVGAIWNQGAGLSADGKPLYSAGGGIRVFLGGRVFVNYEAAYPLSDAPYTENDNSTRHRVQISIAH